MDAQRSPGAGEGRQPDNAKSPSLRSRLFAPTAASKARRGSTPEPGGFVDLSKSSAELAGPPLFEAKAAKPSPTVRKPSKAATTGTDDQLASPVGSHKNNATEESGASTDKVNGGKHMQANGSANGHVNGTKVDRSEKEAAGNGVNGVKGTFGTNGNGELGMSTGKPAERDLESPKKGAQPVHNASNAVPDANANKTKKVTGASPTGPKSAAATRGASPARKVRAPSPARNAGAPQNALARTRSLDAAPPERARGRSPARPNSDRGSRGSSPSPSSGPRRASPSPSRRPASPARGNLHSLSSPTLSSLARRNSGEFARASPRSVLQSAAPSPRLSWGMPSAKSQGMASTRKALGVDSESSSSSENGNAANRRWSTGRASVPGLTRPAGSGAGTGLLRGNSSFAGPEDLHISPDLKLDLKGKRIRKLSSSALSPKLEWVNLRENKLQSLEGIDILKRLKVLHLSTNELKSKALAALAPLQSLQQLFLSSNRLTTLAPLPKLQALTFLSVTQNEITTLEMASFPRLHTLIASKNYITSLADLPHLPALTILKVDDNPVSEDPLARTVAMLLVGKTLKRFNEQEVEPADHFEALSYPPHMAACIRSGFALTPENNTPEHLGRALLTVQSRAGLPPGYALSAASIEPPCEGSPCTATFDFQYTGSEAKRAPLQKRYRWLRGSRHDVTYDVIEGATSAVYAPDPEDVGQCLRVECTPTLGGIAFPAVYAVSSEVEEGSGIPAISDIRVEGEAIEGRTLQGSVQVSWNGAQPGRVVISWWRCQDSAHPFTIPDATGAEYTLSAKDIGHSVWFMCLPIAADGTKGEAQFAQTTTVQQDVPRVTGVQLLGEALTGKKLTVQATYHGGEEGGSVLEWFSQDPATGALTDLKVPNNSREYSPSDSDVGRKIVFRYTPVNSEGLPGEFVSVTTPNPVELAPPELADVAITGSLMEGGKVAIASRYTGGGTEGETRIQWLKSKYPKLYGSLGDSAVIELGEVTTEKELPIPVDAIGWFLGAKVTPVRADGVQGAPVYVAAAEPVVLRPPSVMSISIDGTLVCGETVVGSYEYAGGKEGYSQIAWYLHQDEVDPGTLIQGSVGQKSRLLTRKEVGKFISFRCAPRRADGAEGQIQSAMSQERVKPLPLKLAKLSVGGVHMEGEALVVQHHAPSEPEHRDDWGNYLQEMTYQWFRSEPGSRSTFAPLPAATSAEYRATIDDVGRVLRCEGRAKDAFGRFSEPVHVFSGLIEPAPPSVTNVRLEGDAESGALLRGLGDFSGGVEGASRFEWFRQDYKDGALYPLNVPNNSPEYIIPESEAGRRIVFKYTPISTGGKVGEPGFATSPIIELAAPKVAGLAIVGSLLEGSRVAVIGKYSGGGKEGQSEVQWFKSEEGTVGSGMEAMPQFDNRTEFIIPAEVVDLYLIAKYTPIRIDGERGEPSFVASKSTVQSLPPSVVSIHLAGEMQAGATITAEYKYVGGLEGVSHYGWYLHESPSAPGNLIPGSIGLKERLLTTKEVGKYLSFSVTPRRKDGVEGETKAFVSGERIMPEPLQLRELTISGEPVEGEKLTAVPVLPTEREEWDKFKKDVVFQWYRSAAIGSGNFDSLAGETSSSYSPTFDDIGRRIKCECCVVDKLDRTSGAVAAITEPVEAASPSIRDVGFDGKHMAGSTIRGIGSYFGGKQGASRYEWFRENIRTGEFEPLHVPNNAPEYVPGNDDVGRRIMFKYTPINSYGKAGETVTVTSDPVKPAPPRVVDLSIRGTLTEGSTVTVHAFYVGGGEEGLSRIQWFKSRSPSTGGNDLVELGPVQTKRDLVVPPEAVGWYLLANYVPVRSDGEFGEAVQVVSARPVTGLPPKITSIQLSGAFFEGETLRADYEYSGGYEGNSVYGWYVHENEQDPGVLIPGSVGLKERLLTKRDVGKLVSFKCTPRREEGLEGPSRTAMSPDRIAAAPPECKNLRIVGSPVEHGVLRAEKDYVGGYEGASIYRWYVTQPGEVQKRIEGATTSSYKVRSEDLDCMISVACTPVRIDGVNGDQVWASPVGPIVGGRPFLGHLEIQGRAVEGEVLSVHAGYKGGEKGACNIVWHRIDNSGAETELSKEETITLSTEDIGCRIRASYTPIRADGVQGDEVSATTDVVVEGNPVGVSLQVPPLQEGQEAAPAYSYSGGMEGSSEWGWYRSNEDPQSSGGVSADEMSMELLKVGSTRVYNPTVNDVGHWLLVRWTPVRRDGRRGIPLTATSEGPVHPGPPEAVNVTVVQTGELTLQGSAVYRGGKEGLSQYSWQRQLADGTRELIIGACEREYTVSDDDFGHGLVFGYIPVRADGVTGIEKLSEPAPAILPPLLVAVRVVLKGKAEEREILGAVVEGPADERGAALWERFKKEVQFKWSRLEDNGSKSLLRTSTINGMYKARFEDVGRCLECECSVIDIWGRSSPPLSVTSEIVEPGLPLVERVRVYGRELHSGRFLVKGNYSGGVEGESTFQWYRAIAGSWQLTPILGANRQKYDSNVDDIGFILAAKYTPVREDGVVGEPVTAQTTPIALDPDVARDVTHIVDQQAHKFDVMMATPQGLQARTLDATSKRLKINRSGTKTGRNVTEMKANFKPPFWVEISLSDPYKAVVVLEEDKMVEVVLPTRHERDVFTMSMRKFAQKYR